MSTSTSFARNGTLSGPSTKAQRWRRRRRVLLENLQGWLFAAPFVIGLLTFFFGPMIASLYLSLTSYRIVQPPRFIGLGNYIQMIHDPLILHSLTVTTKYALVSVPLSLFAGLGIAVLLNQKVRALSVWRTVYYLPSVVSAVAVALIWDSLLNPHFGLMNYLIQALFGIQGPNWFGDPRFALGAFIMLSVWQVGKSMLINLAALQGVPTALYDAALVDGANVWRRFLHITVPSISPVIFFNLVMGIIDALQSFDVFFLLTQGGPNNATLTFMLYLYNQGFQYLQMGYGSAMAWLLFVYLVLLTLIVFKSSSAWVYYESQKR